MYLSPRDSDEIAPPLLLAKALLPTERTTLRLPNPKAAPVRTPEVANAAKQARVAIVLVDVLRR